MSYLRARRLLPSLAIGVVALTAAACGGSSSSSGTHYWEMSYTGGWNQYISTTVNGDQIAGQVYYNSTGGPSGPQEWTGQKNADGSFQTTLYSGSTIKFDGDKLIIQDSEATHTAKSVNKSAFEAHQSAQGGS